MKSCCRPRADNKAFCFGHRRLYDRMSWTLQSVHLAQDLAEESMPMDVTDCVVKCDMIGRTSPNGVAPDLILIVLICVLKEPFSTTQLLAELDLFEEGTRELKILADSQHTWLRLTAAQKKRYPKGVWPHG